MLQLTIKRLIIWVSESEDYKGNTGDTAHLTIMANFSNVVLIIRLYPRDGVIFVPHPP